MKTYENLEYDSVLFIIRYKPEKGKKEGETQRFPFPTAEEARQFIYNVTHEYDLETRKRIYDICTLHFINEHGDKIAFLNWYPNHNIFSGVLDHGTTNEKVKSNR